MAKVGGRYFLLTSHLTGWSTNDNVYATATSPAGPWSGFSNFAPAGTRTYDSQTSFLLPVTGAPAPATCTSATGGTPSNLNASLPVWLPITLTGSGTATLNWYDSWGIDTSDRHRDPATDLEPARRQPVRPMPRHHRRLPGQWHRRPDLGLQRRRQPELRPDRRPASCGSTATSAWTRAAGHRRGHGGGDLDCTGGNGQKWTLAPTAPSSASSPAVPGRQRAGTANGTKVNLDLQRRRQPEVDPAVMRTPGT